MTKSRKNKTKKSEGYVYIIKNETMPGLIKIGRSNSPPRRIAELYHTGMIPFPFTCVLALSVKNMVRIERDLHDSFSSHRVNPNREFFASAITEEATNRLRDAGDKDITENTQSYLNDFGGKDFHDWLLEFINDRDSTSFETLEEALWGAKNGRWVFVLSNPSMPELFVLRRSSHSPYAFMDLAYNTSMPEPFYLHTAFQASYEKVAVWIMESIRKKIASFVIDDRGFFRKPALHDALRAFSLYTRAASQAEKMAFNKRKTGEYA